MFIVRFYSRNTGRKLQIPERKFKTEQQAYDYANWVVMGKPSIRFGAIIDSSKKDSIKWVTEVYTNGHFVAARTKRGKAYSRYVPDSYAVAQKKDIPTEEQRKSDYYHQFILTKHISPTAHGPLAPLNPKRKKSKTTQKKDEYDQYYERIYRFR